MYGGVCLAKKSNNKITIETSIVFWILLFIISGLVLIIISSVKFENDIWNDVISNILNAIGTTLLSSGCVSLILEISSMKSMVQTAFSDILECNLPLEAYSNDKLKKLNLSIAAKRLGIDEDLVGKTIYNMEPRLLEYATGLYYEYYTATYSIKPCESEGVFRKTVSLKYEIVNKHKQPNNIEHFVLLYNVHDGMTNEERKEKFRVTKFKINTTDLSNEVENYIDYRNVEKRKHATYNYMAIIKRSLQECERHKIVLEFEYEIPISDINQIFKITKPCKRLEHTIELLGNKENVNNWRVSANAFTSFYCKESDDDKGFSVDQLSDTLVRINFRDWIIPGAGYVVNLCETQENFFAGTMDEK